MITQYFADVLEGGLVRACLPVEAPEVGPVFVPNIEGRAVLLEHPIDWRGPTPTSALHWDEARNFYWVEKMPLAGLQAAAIARTYEDVDAVYDAAIGRRGTEYERAEAAARAYLAAEVKPAAVSEYITGHALNNPTGQVQSETWAAQQIIERADAFRWAELQMRNVRFAQQAAMRVAASPEELAAAVAEWDGFITWLRATLGL